MQLNKKNYFVVTRNFRNMDKPWKGPRIVSNKDGTFSYHQMDNLPLNAGGRNTQTNGCKGVYVGGGNTTLPSMIVKVGTSNTPGQAHQFKKKKGGKKYMLTIGEYERVRLRKLEKQILHWHSKMCWQKYKYESPTLAQQCMDKVWEFYNEWKIDQRADQIRALMDKLDANEKSQLGMIEKGL